MNLPIVIRKACPPDLSFIMSTYIRSVCNQHPWDEIDHNWAAAAAALIAYRFLSTTIYVACNTEDPDQIYGYICCAPEDRILYWIYVKNAFRNAHVGTELMKAAFIYFGAEAPIIRCAHKTASIAWHTDRWGLIFDSHPLVDLAK